VRARLPRFRRAPLLAACFAAAPLAAGGAFAGSVVLDANDFETPNEPIVINCGNSLDIRGINFLYGTPPFVYNQQFTVEVLVHEDNMGLYSDPEGNGGAYSLGMLS
jgi:hypothetical protein